MTHTSSEPYTNATNTASRPVVIQGTIVLVYPWSALRDWGAQIDRTQLVHRGGERRTTTTTVVEGRHVRARVRSCLAGIAIVGDIIESLTRDGAIMGVVNWVCETYHRRTPSSSLSLLSDDGGSDGGGDIVLLGSLIAAPWPRGISCMWWQTAHRQPPHHEREG